MPSNTKFANLWLYNDTSDKMKLFIDYRTHMAGDADDSNMNKIDRWLSTLNDSTSRLKVKLEQIAPEDTEGEIHINSDTLDGKDSTYFESIAGTYNAACAYSNQTYSLSLLDSSISIKDNLFTLRFAAPNNYVDGSIFQFDGQNYTPSDPAFDASQVVLINFDKSNLKCYFSSGSGKGTADKITIISIPDLPNAKNVQQALEALVGKTNSNSESIQQLEQNVNTVIDEKISDIQQSITNITNGDTVVSSAENANTVGGKDLSYIMDYNNLTNLPVGGGSIISNTAPSVSLTNTLWVDTSSGKGILKYSNGTSWVNVTPVWS